MKWHLKLFILSLTFLIAVPTYAQYFGLRGSYLGGVLSDFTFDIDPLRAYGGEFFYSNSLEVIHLDYNLGLDYYYANNSHVISAETAVSKVLLSPSGFKGARDKESVTYIKNNWLIGITLNIYNGIIRSDSAINYIFAAEPQWNASYAITKQFFISGAFGIRYSMIPSAADSITVHLFDATAKLGLLWRPARKYGKP